MQYPDAWANQTPSSDPTSDQPGGVPESQSTSHVANVSQNQNTNSQFQNSTNTVVAPPLDVSRQQLYNGANTAAATAASPGNRITLQSVSGQKRVIALKPRKTHRAVQPGFTSSGEKILFIQSLGLNGNARFVVTDAEGNVRLVSASSAGGQPALDGAKRTGVPYTLQDPAKILELRDLVRCGGVYGLEFVAIGEWDMTNTRLPFIVVLFYHENEKGRREEAISRSSLTKILAKREAEKLVAESIVGDPEMSLKEALMSQVAPKKQEDLSNNVPPLLPYGQQSQPWWFQTTPQHHGSHAVFNAGPLQQPYSNQFQQFVPQQFQQPSIHQFQPGPFAMPPQPVLDSSMMKHGANSPAASMMEEEL
ncbi:hypothetical protein N7510_011601 [Penicillium lagena]|uniref:uncharacterized protein n=1 Tax=Penicillium lagena TaxID=94218 RepID=UPI00253FA99F|nr:uncharacterized protein N7510_011601 [Penicillium lagena]KAJ5602067.1 hypothetical protein N7510_011601 [Penicillium lagena]